MAGGAAAGGTRRELIARGLALGRHGGDIGSLRALARTEQVLVASYEQLLGAGMLLGAGRRLATELQAHERAHLEAITAQLKRLGATPPPRPAPLGRGSASASATAPGRRPAAAERTALETLVSLERAALAVYYAELGRLRDPQAAQVAAEIMACEAQHATALRQLLDPANLSRVVPSPFVFGSL